MTSATVELKKIIASCGEYYRNAIFRAAQFKDTMRIEKYVPDEFKYNSQKHGEFIFVFTRNGHFRSASIGKTKKFGSHTAGWNARCKEADTLYVIPEDQITERKKKTLLPSHADSLYTRLRKYKESKMDVSGVETILNKVPELVTKLTVLAVADIDKNEKASNYIYDLLICVRNVQRKNRDYKEVKSENQSWSKITENNLRYKMEKFLN